MLASPTLSKVLPEADGYLVFEDSAGHVTAIATDATHVGPALESFGRPFNGGAPVPRSTAFGLLQSHGGMLVQRSGVVSCQRAQAESGASWTCYRRSCIRQQSGGAANSPAEAQLMLRPSGSYTRASGTRRRRSPAAASAVH